VPLRFKQVLLVDDSPVYRELMATLLRPYCGELRTAVCAASAIETIESLPDLDLVICDVVMKGDDGFAVLEHVHRRGPSRLQVVMVTGYRGDAGAERARALGAAGYLQKPTTIRQILSAVGGARHGERRTVHPRWRCNGRATLIDPDSGHPGPLTWDLYNISPRGAFLETKGPVPLGSEIDLLLELAGRKAPVRARVVRVQEPSWLEIGGVGVEFLDLDDEAEAAIQSAIEAASLGAGSAD
jgi:CheY-like chemotaxis protein